MRLSPSAPFRTTVGAWAAAAAVSLLFVVGLAAAPIASAADTCDNATARADSASTKLPDCRGYEMVTPPYKEGFSAYASSGSGYFTDDGILQYGSFGSFAGNYRASLTNHYRATRSAAGWSTTALAAPAEIYNTGGANAVAQSVDLRWSLTFATRRALPGDILGFWLRGPDGGHTRVGDAADLIDDDGDGDADDPGRDRFFVVGSSDLSHVVFYHGPQGTGNSQLYEYVGTGNGPDGRAVSVDNNGQAVLDLVCGTEISPDGRVIVFQSGCGNDQPGIGQQVWARLGGSASVAVSGSECTRSAGDPGGVCNGVSDASYVGRAADGSRVFFTTVQQLVNGDTDAGNDLYACDIPPGVPAPVGAANPCATLTQVSGTASDAQVENVIAVSEDGSKAYFVAAGAALADNLGLGGAAPVAGQSNLYVWTKDAAHPAGEVRFVAKLDANDLDASARAQTTSDGRYLLFVTANQLMTAGPGGDSDSAKDAYRYDAVNHSIVRLSTSVSGSGGNAPGPPGSDVSLVPKASMTADGSTVIFDTAEALSLDDTDGVTDVYQWRNGQVSLITVGGGISVGITPSGRDIFFETKVRVLAADSDPNTDVYDARVGGGFAAAPAARCSGDGCQGQRSQSPPLAGPSAPATGDGSASPSPGMRSLISLKPVSAKSRKAAARTGVLAISVTSSSAGRLSVSARASMGRVAAKTVGVRKAGTVKIRLSLSPDARRRLRNGRSLRITLSVTKQGARTRSSSILLPGASS